MLRKLLLLLLFQKCLNYFFDFLKKHLFTFEWQGHLAAVGNMNLGVKEEITILQK